MKSKETIKKEIFEGAQGMLKSCGELVPVNLLKIAYKKTEPSNIVDEAFDELQKENKIQIVENAWGDINDDWFGVKGEKYPIGFENILKFREIRDDKGLEVAQKIHCKTI